MTDAVGEKRGAQVALIYGRLFPKGYTRESFAGKTAKKLARREIATLSTFIETAMKELGVPGVAIGLVQDGKVVFADGFGVRDSAVRRSPTPTRSSSSRRTPRR